MYEFNIAENSASTTLTNALQSFYDRLAAVPSTQTARNVYQNSAVQQHNLRRYLALMWRLRPRILLVAEAPGYRGAARTGVPLTSERLLCGQQILGARFDVIESPRLAAEATATIVWEALADLPQLPLLWNIFPLHPHRAGEPLSNRAPVSAECALGLPFVTDLIDIFAIEQVIALGKKAAHTLEKNGIPHSAIRHPSRGGKRAFRQGLQTAIARSSGHS